MKLSLVLLIALIGLSFACDCPPTTNAPTTTTRRNPINTTDPVLRAYRVLGDQEPVVVAAAAVNCDCPTTTTRRNPINTTQPIE